MTMASDINDATYFMTHILTLVAPQPMTDSDIAPLLTSLEPYTLTRLGPEAVELSSELPLSQLQKMVMVARSKEIDACALPARNRRKRILISDMDSTIITQECLDELAVLAGCGDAIKAITEQAMRGELNFEEALTARVAQLKGIKQNLIADVISALTLSPGAKVFVRTMAKYGTVTALVSGGFTPFTQHVAKLAGFSRHQGNELEIDENGLLTGRLIPPLLGPRAKKETLLEICKAQNIPLEDSLAIGDGANDLDMVKAAGLGVAYRAKPILAEASDAAIHHTGLTTALYFQGYKDSEFVY
ncbi:MAG: phosphoserine phosphatase SerB [Pseudomonadota bacterium]